MYAFYRGARIDLAQDDIDGIRFIYGSPIQFINGANDFCGSKPQSYIISQKLYLLDMLLFGQEISVAHSSK